ncbi:hypothetical protein MMC25_001260 [Agyrium rufum]|nr:hypothetical protein [Agyrium rufum]
MVFIGPPGKQELSRDPPDSIPICDFMLKEEYGRFPLAKARAPYTCGLSGKEYNAFQVRDRVDHLARALSKELDWQPNKGIEWDKVLGLYSVNTIDTLTVSWAVHRLSGISSPANSAYSTDELAYQLKDSGASALFTCLSFLPNALKAAEKCNIPKSRIYLLPAAEEALGKQQQPQEFKTIDTLIEAGSRLPALESLRWEKGQGARQTAFLCYSSGTSGLPKGVMISHRNVIANVLQISELDQPYRDSQSKAAGKEYTDVVLGLLPKNHIYGLVVVCHLATYRGDQVITLPKFEMKTYLDAIQRFKINTLMVVPPILVLMIKNKNVLEKYDLSSVTDIWCGAAPTGAETLDALGKMYPTWAVRQAYGIFPLLLFFMRDFLDIDYELGMTESSTVTTLTAHDDIFPGSVGQIAPACQARIVSIEGTDITGYDQPGELLVKAPSVTLGYHNNVEATRETFQDGWLRTGDEAVIRKSPKGVDHVFIVDRIKELIKVKGHQVAPAELEAHLLTHPSVADCAVISIPDAEAGEAPRAYVVKDASNVGLEDNDRMVKRDIQKHVEKDKARYKWLKGGVVFVDTIPKSASGKILRRMLRDMDKEKRRKEGAKI